MANDLFEAVREICLWLPESEEFISHGSPNFRVRGKTFASYLVNHHGDGRVALWLAAMPGAQEMHVRARPRHFFVPPYVGVRGWLGVNLDRGLAWKAVAALVREGYEKVAPPKLAASIGKTPAFTPPKRMLKPADIDPFKAPRVKAVLDKLRRIVAKLPETSEERQFGHPAWRVGKKTFVIARHYGQFSLCFWVGIESQGLLLKDARYQMPQYMGHNGWIALDVGKHADWKEIEQLCLQSFRHFALRRMLKLLGEP